MRKILMAATAALCFAGGSFANDVPGGDKASEDADGSLKITEELVVKVVLVTAVAVMVNADGDTTAKIVDPVEPVEPVDPVCGPGEELVDGECTPVVTPPPVTTTVTTSVTTSVTTPVTITATSTAL
jgi:hypothetical protein